MSPDFKACLLNGYTSDAACVRINVVLDTNMKDSEDAAKLPFERDTDGLLWHVDAYITLDLGFQPSRLVIPKSLHKEIFELIHTKDGHPGFQRCMDRLQSSFYIRQAAKNLRDYLQHC